MPKPWYIDGFGAHYLELYAHRNDREALQSLKLLDVAGLDLAGRVLLDLGCGPGRHLAALSRRGAKVLGLDLSRDLLRVAAGRGLDGEQGFLLRGDMRKLPLSNSSVDGVLSMFTSFGYFPEDAENWTVLDEVARVLRPGGFYLFDFLNRSRVERDLRSESEVEGVSFTAKERRRVEGDRVFKEVRILERESALRRKRQALSERRNSRFRWHSWFERCEDMGNLHGTSL
jgi:SAM-dependent methyltransferase